MKWARVGSARTSLRELKRAERSARGGVNRLRRGVIPSLGSRVAESGPERAERLRALVRGDGS